MKKIAVLLAEGFEEIEAVSVIDVMRRLGADVTVCGVSAATVTGAHQVSFGTDALLDEVDTAGFDAVYLPGGMPGAVNLLNSPAVNTMVKTMHNEGKVVSAICAAPIVFGALGILKDRRFTMYPGFESYLNGAAAVDSQAELDGNVVTGRGPGAVYDFAAKLAEALGMASECAELYKAMFVR